MLNTKENGPRFGLKFIEVPLWTWPPNVICYTTNMESSPLLQGYSTIVKQQSEFGWVSSFYSLGALSACQAPPLSRFDVV